MTERERHEASRRLANGNGLLSVFGCDNDRAIHLGNMYFIMYNML